MAKKTSSRTANHPEKKIKLQPGGIGVAIWTNTIETSEGRKKVRSITLNPRRYRDSQTGEWKDAGSYNPSDLPALIAALEKAQDFCFSNPLPGEEKDENADTQV